jgi:hypothetical protein
MGGYQLPALAIRPPAPQDPGAEVQRALTIRALMNNQNLQQQLQPLQVQQQQAQTTMATTQAAMAVKQQQDMQAMSALAPQYTTKDDSGRPTGFDVDGFSRAAIGKGVNPLTINAWRQNQAETTQKLAAADKATRENADALNGEAYNRMQSMDSIDDPQGRQQSWNSFINWAGNNKIDTSKLSPNAPDHNGVLQAESIFGMHAQQVADAGKQAETNAKISEMYKNRAQGGESIAQTGKINLETNADNPADPQIREQKYLGILDTIKTNGLSALQPKDLQWAQAYEASQKKATTQSDTLGVTSNNISGPAGLASVGAIRGTTAPVSAGVPASTPQGGTVPQAPASPNGMPVKKSPMDALIDSVGQYQTDPQILSRMMYRHPEVLGLITQKYPDFNSMTYPNRFKLLKDYTKSAGDGQISSINTALGHAGELYDAAQALNQNNIPLIHSIASKVGAEFGSDAATTYTNILHRVGPEMTSAYVKGGGGQSERGANESDFDATKLGQQQIISNIGESAKLLNSKLDSLRNNWNQTMQPNDASQNFDNKFITPAAQATLAKLSAKAPGASSQFRGPIQPSEHQAVGPNNHTIVYRGNKWVDPDTGLEVTGK